MKKFIVETYYTCTFKTIHNNSDKREEVIQTAFNKAKSHYSHDVVKERFLGVVNG